MAIRTLKPWLEKSSLVAMTVGSLLLLQWNCLSTSAVKILSSCIFRSSMVLFLQARAVTYVHIPWLSKANSGQSIVFTLSLMVWQVSSMRGNAKLLQLPWLHLHITTSNNPSKLNKRQQEKIAGMLLESKGRGKIYKFPKKAAVNLSFCLFSFFFASI